ncbi:imidazolonepropionase [Iodidimonas muriae]|uniref:Imidazolonepropionase n=1 Tax=Iodidimonas muriae TaxID=261467 RepID=A0ABQ2L712_9PROT|nr:imidazolonepropionase [Iodidimonas muriae]GER06531.1 imidazolonepropionase [Kordiimonadales bacterium JCM 17843]GGO05168.1 imidazolonepropionase [Iodidimonas muriae]
MWDRLYTNGHVASMDPNNSAAFGAIHDAALGIKDGRIIWIGKGADLPDRPAALAHMVTDIKGAWITPGLIDCHTHLVFGGNRVREFDLRLNGASYEDIAKAGGGIAATVKATRAATEDDLFDSALTRLDQMRAQGLTSIEIKSGYGLDRDTELKMLRVAGKLANARPITVRRTFLGAHAVPPDGQRDADAYIDWLCTHMIPDVARQGLADTVDGFCETIGFTPEQIDRLFKTAKAHGLALKLHAEQLSNQQGAALAARHGALSADHLEYLDQTGVAAMAKAGTLAVLLPGAFYALRETKLPPVDDLRRHKVPIAIASDCNPGSAPLLSPLLTLNMACTLFRLTPYEALAGMTIHAARALGLQDDTGMLRVGMAADLAIWAIFEPAELCYWIGGNPLMSSLHQGKESIAP